MTMICGNNVTNKICSIKIWRQKFNSKIILR